MSSNLPMDCRKIISRWTRDDLYVYMRPISSHWIDADAKHSVYWSVLVEYRNVEWQQWRAEGPDLADCIRNLAEQIPRRRVMDPGWRPGKSGGWLAPKAVEAKAEAHTKKQNAKLKKISAKSSKKKKVKR